ncbi:autotransporter-associated beta strand repeat-containing protein [Sphingobium lignivorans]|uniref:T5SS/PEP-CTERM-associated repeat protein/autotransporter-associated beta strand protein n=1 Tax=Sphingobium lignivorans TaxID=2735886 RepID=A0ABR6NAX1_9SPHN|nr:autotransporter-associated beta strand repeat-containing protein [Sphingobium lignivorans]MBB5984423.1 T5SS/PEP-CTERM-associated repeat protein/autotransporter-associated beta strand protein [Sphingobium lignivorans]
MQVEDRTKNSTVRKSLKAGFFTSVGLAGLLAGAPAWAEPSVCETTGDVMFFNCGTSITYRAESGETSLTVTGAELTDGTINYNANANAEGPLTSTLTVTDSIVNATDYGGINMFSANEGGNTVTISLGEDVSITSSAGFAGVWVRNEVGGDIDITSAAELNVSGTDTNGISATTNSGSVHINNSGDITVAETLNPADYTQRGIYADGGYTNVEPVEVEVINSGKVSAQAAGIRVVNYNGLARIENSGEVSSVNNQGLVAWTPNGEVEIVNSAQGSATSLSGPAIQGASQIGDISIANDGSAEGVSGILAIAGFDSGQPGGGSITISNSGAVTATGGIGVSARTPDGDVSFTNTGSISAVSAGVDLDTIDGKVLITNSGTIEGYHGIVTNDAATRIVNSGTIATNGNGSAIVMGSGDVTLELHAGSAINGLVQDADPVNGTNTLVLGGADNASFNAGSIGADAQYRDFDAFVKAGDSIWTLNGEGTTGWTVEAGTLTADTGGAFGVDQAYVVNGGTLDFAGTTASIASVTGTSEGSVNIGTGGGLTLNQGTDGTYAGQITGSGKLTKAGSGTLTLTGDSSSFSGNLFLTGGETVLDGNSMAAGIVFLGSTDEPMLTVQNGGVLNAANVIVGNSTNSYAPYLADESGSLSVTGSGSAVNADFLTVGYYGDGALSISGGGTVTTSTVITVGSVADSAGTITISGENSRLQGGNLQLAGSGTAVLSVSEGATIETSFGGLGVNAGSIGTATISGANTRWDITQSGLAIATSGEGQVSVLDGATVAASSGDIRLGAAAGGQGSLTVSGMGSSVSTTENFIVGSYGTGNVTVDDGGQIQGDKLIVGFVDGGAGTLNLSGAGTHVQGNTYIMVGTYAGSSGTVTLSDGATLKADGTRGITLAFEAGSAGTLNIGAAAGEDAAAAGSIEAEYGIQFGNGTGNLVLNHNEAGYELATGLSGAGVINILAGETIFSGNGSAFSGTLDISGGSFEVTSTLGADHVSVGGVESAHLSVVQGGVLESNTGSIGMGGTNGSVTIDGPGSSWVSSGGIQISRDGGSTGSLAITDGGSFETVLGGLYMGAGGSISVSGEGSSLLIGTLHSELPASWNDADGWFSVDEGTVSITDGALLATDGSYIGGSGTTVATMTVDGENTVWSNGIPLFIGGTGNGTVGHGDVTVSGGATVTSYTSALGVDTGSSGKLTLTGEGTIYTVLDREGFAGNMRVGYNGTGTVTVSNGALLAAAALVDVASQSGSEGTLLIENGGHVTGQSMRIGGQTETVGSVTVDGEGSTLVIGSDRIGVGISGNGTLTVSNGGSASSEGAVIGWEAGGKGTVTVTGAGSTFSNDGSLYVGNVGEGTLNVSDGGRVTSTDGYVGTVAGSKGVVTVSGAESIWDMSGVFIVGNEATARAEATISDGGTLRAVQGTLGNLNSSFGRMTVTGAGSTWSAYDDGITNWAGYLNVGLSGSGLLNVWDGGTVDAVRLYIGNDAGSSGTVLLTGAGSTIRTEQGLYVGAEGTGELTLMNGAHIEAQTIKVGYLAGSTGTLIIGGLASQPAAAAGTINADEIHLGSGNSRLVLNHTSTDYELGANLTGFGDVDVLAGTTVLSGDSSTFAGSLAIDGGRLILASASNAVSTSIGTEGTLQIGNGGTSGSLNGDIVNNGSLVFDRSDALHHNRVISGTGDLTVAGGVITLSGMNTFTGATIIDTGATLALSNQGRINQSSLVTVNGTFDVTEGSAPRIKDIAGNGTVVLGNAGLQIDNASHVFSGSITGEGGLNLNGGILTLTGASDFTNGLGISNGAVVNIGNGGTSGSITSGTTNYGTLVFDRSDEWTYGGAITGQGEIIHAGSGTTNLTGGMGGSHFIIENGTVNMNGGLVALLGDGAGISVEGQTSVLNVSNVGARANHTVYRVSDGGSLAINGGSVRVGTAAGSAGVHLVSGSASVTGTSFDVKGASTYGVIVEAGNTLTLADSSIKTIGNSAIGALARDGGVLDISGSTVQTTGTDAYAAYAANGGQITLANSTISTSGMVADALVSDGEGSLISATNTTIETNGTQTAAVVARNNGAIDLNGGSVSATVNEESPAAVWALLAKDGGSITATDVNLSLTMLDNSAYVTGVAYAMDEGSSITLTGGTATATGKRANGIFAYNSGSVSAEGLTISTSGEQARGVYANADSNAAGSVTLKDASISANGTSSHGLFAERDSGSTGNQIATITGENVNITTSGDQANGIYAAVGGVITVTGGSVTTTGYQSMALAASGSESGMTGGGILTVSDVTAHTLGNSAAGANVYTAGQIVANNVTILTEGSSAQGIVVAAGIGTFANSTIATTGNSSTGTLVRYQGQLTLTNSAITTSGAQSAGVTVGGNSQAQLTDSSVATSGEGARGLFASTGLISVTGGSVTTSGAGSDGLNTRGNGAISLTGTEITVRDASSAGASIEDNGIIDMTAGSIRSAGSTLAATSTDDSLARFSFAGTDLASDSGALLSVAHGPGEGTGIVGLLLTDGSTAKGDIASTGEGILDVLVSASSLEGGLSNVSKLTLDNAAWTVTNLAGLGELEIATGTATISTTGTVSHDGALTGSGTFNKTGTGQFILAGNGSDFAGATQIDAGSMLLTGSLAGSLRINAQGTMIVGDGVTSGDLIASTVNDGTLIFNQLGDYDYAGALSGSGGLVKRGSGTLLLSGDYGYTGSTVVEGGKIRLLAQLDSATDLVINDGEFDLSGTDQTVAGPERHRRHAQHRDQHANRQSDREHGLWRRVSGRRNDRHARAASGPPAYHLPDRPEL